MRMPVGEMPKRTSASAGLEGDQRRLIHVSPGKVMAADEEVELVAEVAVAEVSAPQRAQEMGKESDQSERGGKEQGAAERCPLGKGRQRSGQRLRQGYIFPGFEQGWQSKILRLSL